ncbi:hypothetical protein [Trebonia sp.]|uniref:hypothetical protein n=1 Tax=Trebonia sp. TaxID=2767075 RepID=UPI0026349BE6|nr:hypothetical protein [Trebonia sp.]
MVTIKPTNATRTAAHIVVGVAAAVVVPKLTGKGVGAALIGAVIAVFLHDLLDAPVAQAMVSAGIQL